MPVPNIPANYLCPITVQIMFDPVIAEDGCTYEREAIEQWFNNGHNNSPMGHGIIGSLLIPNRDKKFDIIQFLDNHANFIHEAIKSSIPGDDNLEFINAVIKRNKANLDRQDAEGQTPLHTAVIYKKLNIIKLLLQAGADYKIRNNQHKTPKREAKEHEFWDIVNIIELEIKSISLTKLSKVHPQIDESSPKQGIFNQIEIMQYEAKSRDSIVELEETVMKQIKTELDVAMLTRQMQRLSVSRQPQRYLKFFTWEMIGLLALGTAVAAHAQRKLDKHSKTIDCLTTQLSELKIDLTQQQQTHKEAISFLYDKMKDAHKVAFKTGEFAWNATGCTAHGTPLPIPEGFEKKDCSFFSAGQSSFNGDVQHLCSTFKISDFMELPYEKGGGRCLGAYGVWAAKPVVSEEDIKKKKHQYKLLV